MGKYLAAVVYLIKNIDVYKALKLSITEQGVYTPTSLDNFGFYLCQLKLAYGVIFSIDLILREGGGIVIMFILALREYLLLC